MEIFDVLSMNGIENYPAADENFLENVILKRGGGGGSGLSLWKK